MPDQGAERDIAAVRPFLQDRSPEKPDGIWRHWLIHHRTFGERDALIKPCQVIGVVHSDLGQHSFRGEILDPKHNRSRHLRISFGQGVARCICHRLNLGQAGGFEILPIHARDMDKKARL